MTELKRCPCGKTPDKLFIQDAGQGGKWAYVGGDCCDSWEIEFRTSYYDIDSKDCEDIALEAWNSAPRGARQ